MTASCTTTAGRGPRKSAPSQRCLCRRKIRIASRIGSCGRGRGRGRRRAKMAGWAVFSQSYRETRHRDGPSSLPPWYEGSGFGTPNSRVLAGHSGEEYDLVRGMSLQPRCFLNGPLTLTARSTTVNHARDVPDCPSKLNKSHVRFSVGKPEFTYYNSESHLVNFILSSNVLYTHPVSCSVHTLIFFHSRILLFALVSLQR